MLMTTPRWRRFHLVPSAAPPVLYDFIVAPDGLSTNLGTLASPWPLDFARTGAGGQIAPIPGRDIIVGVRGGVSTRDWNFTVSGLANSRVQFRPYNNERVITDNPVTDLEGFQINGAYFDLWGFEYQYTNSVIRVSTDGPHGGSYSNPQDIGGRWMKSLNVKNHDVRIINCDVHDTGDCTTDQTVVIAYNNLWYGNRLYNGGWNGPDRGHAYPGYMQNENVLGKSRADEVAFACFGGGYKIGGSSSSSVKHFLVRGVASFNHAGYSPYGFLAGLEVTGGQDTGTTDITVDHSSFYIEGIKRAVNFGDSGTTPPYAGGAKFNDNIVNGAILLSGWPTLEFQRNKINSRIGYTGGMRLIEGYLPTGKTYSDWIVNSNQYSYISSGDPFFFQARAGVGVDYATRAALNAATAWESAGSLILTPFPVADIVHRPNQFEPGRGWTHFHNWLGVSSLNLDLAGYGLALGDKYVVHHAYDVYGPPILSGTYAGLVLPLGQTGYVAPPPLGWPGAAPASASPYFNVFQTKKVDTLSVPASAPVIVAATGVGSRKINVSWTYTPFGNEKGFIVEQQIGSQWRNAGIALAGATNLDVYAEIPLTSYTYRVRAYTEAGYGPASGTASGTTLSLIFVSETMTGAPSTLLSAHVGEIGATWTLHPAYATGTAQLTNANRVRHSGSATAAYYASGIPETPDYDAYADETALGSLPVGTVGICGRMDPVANTMYHARYNSATGRRELYRFVNGVAQLLDSAVGTPGGHPVLRMRDRTITYLVDGVAVLSPYLDATPITAAGRMGLRFTYTSGVLDDTNSLQLDNVGAANA